MIVRYGLMTLASLMMVAKFHHVLEYLFIGMLILWGSVKVSRQDFHFVRTPLDLPILLFLVWIAATIPFSVDPTYSLTEWRKTVSKILMFYFVVNVVRNEQDVRRILLAFMVGVVSLSAYGIVDYVARGHNLFSRGDGDYAASLTSAGQWFSSYLVMAVPFAWLFFQERKGRHATLSVGGVFVLIMVALFLSHTRGAWVALFAQLTALGLLRAPSGRYKCAVAVGLCLLLILVGGFLFMGFQDTLLHNVSGGSLLSFGTMNIRLSIWHVAVEQIVAQPLMGYGYGNYTFQKINEELPFNVDGFPTTHVHNVWISLAYEVGLPGFTLFAFVLFVISRTALLGRKEKGRTFMGNLGVCVFLLVIGMITRNIFDNMFAGSLAYLFWLLTGLYFALWLRRDAGGQVSP